MATRDSDQRFRDHSDDVATDKLMAGGHDTSLSRPAMDYSLGDPGVVRHGRHAVMTPASAHPTNAF
jgi:hypothetical protein